MVIQIDLRLCATRFTAPRAYIEDMPIIQMYSELPKAGSRLLVARARVRGCGRAHEPRYKPQTSHETRARAAPTVVGTSRDARKPLDDKSRTGNQNLVFASPRILPSASLRSN